jgi:hypothetical protein
VIKEELLFVNLQSTKQVSYRVRCRFHCTCNPINHSARPFRDSTWYIIQKKLPVASKPRLGPLTTVPPIWLNSLPIVPTPLLKAAAIAVSEANPAASKADAASCGAAEQVVLRTEEIKVAS